MAVGITGAREMRGVADGEDDAHSSVGRNGGYSGQELGAGRAGSLRISPGGR